MRRGDAKQEVRGMPGWRRDARQAGGEEKPGRGEEGCQAGEGRVMPTEARRALPGREGGGAGAARPGRVSSQGLRGRATRVAHLLPRDPGPERGRLFPARRSARPGACAAAALSGGGAGSVCKERGA